MTALLDAPRPAREVGVVVPVEERSWATLRVVGEHAAVALALGVWALPLTHATGGRDPGWLRVGLVTVGPALLLVRPWARLCPAVTVPAAVLSVAALLVCALSPTGWSGADDATSYAYAAGLTLTVAAWARSPLRRTVLAAVIGLAAIEQFTQAFLPWWGGRDPGARMTGTFYWHNPFAAFLLPGALLGLVLVVRRQRPVAAVGWVAAPLATAGVVLSTSRATLAVLALGAVAVTGLSLRAAGRSALPRLLATSAACAGAVLVLPGPPFFAHRVSAFAGTAARSGGGETLAANGGYRLEFWREGLAVARQHPWTGAGYHSLTAASSLRVPASWAHSNLAHQGLLQAFSDGGILLGLPLLVVVALAVARCLRLLLAAMRCRSMEPVPAAAAVALLCAVAHSFVDFDWSHPALLALDGLLVALVVAPTAGSGPGSVHIGRVRADPVGAGAVAAASLTVALAVALAVAAAADTAAVRVRHDLVAAQQGTVAQQASALLVALHRPLAGPAPARRLLALAAPVAAGSGLRLPRSEASVAVTATARAADADPLLAVERARVALALNNTGPAEAVTATLVGAAADHPAFAAAVAPLLAELGRPGDADALLLPDLREALATGSAFGTVTADALVLSAGAQPGEQARCAEALANAVPGARATTLPRVAEPVDRPGCAALLGIALPAGPR